MTYFAPRQGLFAVVILLSLSLHLLFFVLGQNHRLTEQYQQIAENNANIIAQEVAIAMQAKDRVSLSVIANRYAQDDNVDFIGIYDTKDTLLVPVGKQTEHHIIAHVPITVDNQVLGSVGVQTKAVNRSLIISDNWLYLISVLVLHFIIYLVYGYIARPSANMLKKITEDVRLRLLASGIVSEEQQMHHIAPASLVTASPLDKEHNDKTTDDDHATAQKTDNSSPPVVNDTLPPAEDLPFISLVAVQIRFEDPDDLLSAVSHHTKSTYFNLCNQILVKAVQELLKLPVLSGVSLHSLNDYDDNGTTVLLKADNRHAKATTAGVMLARLIVMLNQIVYDKHRELKRFCLTTRGMVSDFEHQKEIVAVSKNHRERVLILIPEAGIIEAKSYVNFERLSKPRTALERQSYYLKLVSESTLQRLFQVRDAVLLSE